jgi:LysM repeat protein
MTKEAKIGMLTGLGLIVLIGVLLTEYLGDKNTATANVQTGRMAQLPVDGAYRDRVTNPVGVPAMAPAGPVVQVAGGTAIAVPVRHENVAPPVMAAEVREDAVLPVGPVTPIEGGPVLADARMDGPPVISLRDRGTVPVRLQDPPKPAAVTHTVAAGDTLAKIAKRDYGSAKNSDVLKIVAANPTLLKDASTMLVVNKNLVIPGTAPATSVVAPSMAVGPVPGRASTGGSADGVKVYLPSSSMTEALPPTLGAVQAPKADAAKAGGPKTDAAKADNKDTTAKKSYVVQSGDTLEKIAKRLAPSKSSDMVQKLMSLNGIKDPTKLQVGVPLKVPA